MFKSILSWKLKVVCTRQKSRYYFVHTILTYESQKLEFAACSPEEDSIYEI